MFGCESELTSTQVTGDLKGSVVLYDAHNKPVPDKSGVRVQVEGTEFSTESDASGKWMIKGLPTRTYSLAFSKEGYGTMKNTSFSFVGGGLVNYGTMDLVQPVTWSLVLDSVLPHEENTVDSNGFIVAGKQGYIGGHFTNIDLADMYEVVVNVYIGTSPDIDPNNSLTYKEKILLYASGGGNINNIGSQLVFSTFWQSYATYFKSKQMVYVMATGMNIRNDGAAYYDINTDKWISSNHPASTSVVSAIVP